MDNNSNNQPALSKEQIDSVISLYSTGRLSDAINTIKSLNELYPNVPLLFNILGACHKAQGSLEESIKIFKVAIEIKPDYAEAHNNLGLTLMQLNQIDSAIDSFKTAIAIFPAYAEAYNYLGVAFKRLNQFEEASESYQEAIAIKPDYAEAHNNLGNVLKSLGRLKEAIKSYKTTLLIKPNFVEAHNNLGSIFKDLKQFNSAIKCFKTAIVIKPNFVEAYYNLGLTLIDLEQLDDAVKYFNDALAIKSEYVEVHNNLGNALKSLGKPYEAIESYEKALSIKPDYAEAHNNLGVTLMSLGQWTLASECLKKALNINSDYAFANNNYGSVLKHFGKFNDSTKFYEKALSIKPDFFEAHHNLGNALKYLKRHDESLLSYERSFALNPDADYVLGNIIHSKLHLCIWDDLLSYYDELIKKINNKEGAIHPFALLALIDNPELHKKAAEIYINDKYPKNYDLPEIDQYPRHKKIRIGYFSADFRAHPVGNLTAELYEIHDRSQFEVYAFSFGPDTNDEVNIRIKAGVDYFNDVSLMSHKEVVMLSRSIELDIAIDLGGFTQDTRTGIFAMQAAPIQINYLGYSSTMGADYMDYIIADRTLIPKNKQKYYSEKIVYLPDSFMVNDTKNKKSIKEFTRKEMGLPSKGFVFCCFNHHYKITPLVFTSWMKILSKVDDSILWLSDGNKTGINNLKKEAEKNGVNKNRLFFAPRLDLREDHLNRIKLADLFLDTLPYNAHATTSDALQVGLPVLTCIGESFASRVAASLINSVDLPELITSTQEQYEELAIELAIDPLKLNAVKEKLNNNLLLSPLYNTPLYTKHLEKTYLEIYERCHKGLEPDHIYC